LRERILNPYSSYGKKSLVVVLVAVLNRPCVRLGMLLRDIDQRADGDIALRERHVPQ
jgi:hypothetical protein